MIRACTQADVIDPAVALAFVSMDGAGGTVLFAGTVRSPSDGEIVDHLDYEVWEDRADAALNSIAQQALDSYDVSRIYVAHRTGRVGVGEASVIVAVSAPHRGAAFDAAEWIIDTLKQTAPIWKKEVKASGESTWVNHP